MTGIFKGREGSCGFHKGQVYDIFTYVEFGRIWIKDKNSELKCPYTTLEKLLKNWDVRE